MWLVCYGLIFSIRLLTCLVPLFDRKFQVFKKSPNWPFLGIFNQLLSTQNENIARSARNLDCDFFCDFLNTVILTSDAKGHHFCYGCKNQNCLIRFRGNTRCSLELFLRNAESSCHLIMCKYLMTRKDILHCSFLQLNFNILFKMSLLISWNIQSLWKNRCWQ